MGGYGAPRPPGASSDSIPEGSLAGSHLDLTGAALVSTDQDCDPGGENVAPVFVPLQARPTTRTRLLWSCFFTPLPCETWGNLRHANLMVMLLFQPNVQPCLWCPNVPHMLHFHFSFPLQPPLLPHSTADLQRPLGSHLSTRVSWTSNPSKELTLVCGRRPRGFSQSLDSIGGTTHRAAKPGDGIRGSHRHRCRGVAHQAGVHVSRHKR